MKIKDLNLEKWVEDIEAEFPEDGLLIICSPREEIDTFSSEIKKNDRNK